MLIKVRENQLKQPLSNIYPLTGDNTSVMRVFATSNTNSSYANEKRLSYL